MINIPFLYSEYKTGTKKACFLFFFHSSIIYFLKKIFFKKTTIYLCEFNISEKYYAV